MADTKADTAGALSPVEIASFTDEDDWTASLRTSDLEYIRTAAVQFEARLTRLCLGEIGVRRARFGAAESEDDLLSTIAVTRGAVNPGRVVLFVTVGASRAFNGEAIQPADILVLTPGCEIELTHRRHHDWASLDIAADAFEALLRRWEIRPIGRGTHGIAYGPAWLDGRGGGASLFGTALVAAADLAEAVPAVAVPAAAGGGASALEAGLQDVLLRSLGAAEARDRAPLRQPRATRDLVRLVRAADEYLCAHIERPIYSDELCAALAASARKVHNAFAAVYGLSPHAYLKRRRLGLVRRALRSGAHPAQMVKAVALAHGFWQLGNFAHDYRAMFGELPSETLASVEASRT
jgi:AraC family transcriptional regulator, ethanolamine operon transcriptional activator